MKPTRDLSGQTFGRLTAVQYVGESKWLCRCECGKVTQVLTSNLTRGNSTSCGCKHEEARYRHGMSKSKLHGVWKSMRARCKNPNDPAYRNYGGRGIRVCERWDDFSLFLKDMGPRPPNTEIDRIDVNGDYEPSNCRWATKKVNLNNRRDNHLVTWRGETLPLTAWAERLGMNPITLYHRLTRGKLSFEEAMTKPVQRYRRKLSL